MNLLSSPSTFVHKVVFPALWVGILGGVNLIFFVQGSPPFPGFVPVFLIGCALNWFLGVRLKKVWLDGDDLVISNFRREARVPVATLVRVRQSGFATRPELVWLEFDHDTTFGRTIVFTPRWRFFGQGGPPVADELETAMRRARTLADVRAKRAMRDVQ